MKAILLALLSTQAPLVDSLMNELGIKGGDINGFTSSLSDQK